MMQTGSFYRVFFYSLFLLLIGATVHAADTTRVRTFNKQTIVTDPSKGNNLYKTWSTFPAANVPVRQIKMVLTLGCPSDMRCADWDYKDHITIRRTGGANGTSKNFEIGRMLTPYGGAFAKDWQFKWEVDVTDFSLLLRDSVEIEYNHTGYEPNNDRGWSITLDFEIIKGKPVMEPISIQPIYDGSYAYGNATNSIENSLKPVTFTADKQANMARLRVVQTGHGMDKPDGCGEFCNKYREVWYDGKLIDKRAIWKKCGNNPLYPQAGTWVYDRANWCPGDLMQPDLYDLPVKGGGQHTIDINMQQYVAPDPSALEVISAYLIQYKKGSADVDVAVADIIAPSTKDAYLRYNPASMQPTILVKNNGTATVTKMAVQYGIKGFEKSLYNWKGTLAPGAVDTIVLPGTISNSHQTNVFEVEVYKPNGKKDAYSADNKQVSYLNAVPVFDSTIIVYVTTNNQPEQNSYTLVDSKGKIVAQKSAVAFEQNNTYRDTIALKQGHYRFAFLDSGGNGLEFWANARGGRGKLRLLDGKGNLLHDFNPDFGSMVQYDFVVGQPVTPVQDVSSISLFPTRTNDLTTLDYFANFANDVVVQIITDPGDNLVEEHRYPQLREGIFTYDLSRFPKGRFYLKVLVNGTEMFKKRIRLKE